MDIKFQPQKIELTIFLTPAEAKEILIDFPKFIHTGSRPIIKLQKALIHISKMTSDEVIKESLSEMDSDYSLSPDRLPPGVVPGQTGDSWP